MPVAERLRDFKLTSLSETDIMLFLRGLHSYERRPSAGVRAVLSALVRRVLECPTAGFNAEVS